MMPRRPHEAQRRFIFAAHDAVDGIGNRTGSQKRGVVRFRPDDGISFQHAPTAADEFGDFRHVGGVMKLARAAAAKSSQMRAARSDRPSHFPRAGG